MSKNNNHDKKDARKLKPAVGPTPISIPDDMSFQDYVNSEDIRVSEDKTLIAQKKRFGTASLKIEHPRDGVEIRTEQKVSNQMTPEERNAEIRNRYNEGEKEDQLALEFGFSQSTVSRIINGNAK